MENFIQVNNDFAGLDVEDGMPLQSPGHIQELLSSVSAQVTGKVLSYLPPQCKARVFASQFLGFNLAVFRVEQISNVLTVILTKFV